MFARIASIIPKALTATGANLDFIGRTTRLGTKRMCVSVSTLHLQRARVSFLLYLSACNCDNYYSTGNCAEGSGQCECKPQFQAPHCDSCSFGYYDYPLCKPCDCHLNGTRDLQCEAKDGQCPCRHNYGGKFCKECADTFFNFPECDGTLFLIYLGRIVVYLSGFSLRV